MFNFLKKLTAIGLLCGFLFALAPVAAQATSLGAVRVSTTGAGTLIMAPGEVKNITVTFQNTGTSVWKNDGPGYISLYTYGPKYRTSLFDPGTWLSPSQVKRMIEPAVVPQGIATLSFQLRAPQTEGSYTEVFSLASEDTAWILGGEFSLYVTVKKGTVVTPTVDSLDTQAASSDGYRAQLITQTANSLKMKAGKTISFTALFQNTGTTTWSNFGIKASDLAMASTSTNIFTHSTWNGDQMAFVSGQVVKPGESAVIQFFFTAPKTNGIHTAKFQLTANDVSVPEAFVELPVTVTEGAASALNTPVVEADVAAYIDEPTIRVGILILDEETDWESYITSYESDFELKNTEGQLLSSHRAGEKVRIAYADGKYFYGADKQVSALPVRFEPQLTRAVMTITNFDARVTRGSSRANNAFRGVLEIRYNQTYERTWVINELGMEDYLRGLAETSNASHLEFQKALITAARTYAFYHWQRATKHRAEGYHVDAYYDQVYRGYSQEEITPRLTEAVQATRGQIVTYEGNTAITAYYSRSNGQTRDWSDVWGGDVPWSKSVSVPCDAGKIEWGHGVGMAASGALCMANEGVLFEPILKHFYTGIELAKKWR